VAIAEQPNTSAAKDLSHATQQFQQHNLFDTHSTGYSTEDRQQQWQGWGILRAVCQSPRFAFED
jgi:hypothetical protein